MLLKMLEEGAIFFILKLRKICWFEMICTRSSSWVKVCFTCVCLRLVSWMVWHMIKACLGTLVVHGTWLHMVEVILIHSWHIFLVLGTWMLWLIVRGTSLCWHMVETHFMVYGIWYNTCVDLHGWYMVCYMIGTWYTWLMVEAYGTCWGA